MNRATERDALDEYVTLIRNFQEKIGLLDTAEERTAI